MYNVYGVECASYDEACMVAGIETPAQLKAEAMFISAAQEVGVDAYDPDNEMYWTRAMREPVECVFCAHKDIPF